MGSSATVATVRRRRFGILRDLVRALRRILSGLLRAAGILYWMCLARRWPRPHEVRFFFAGWPPANLILRRAEMPTSNGTAAAPATAQKAPRTNVSGILGNVTPSALTVGGQPYARGKVFEGTWPSPNDVGRSCELTLVQARTGMFVVAIALAASAAKEAAETEAPAPRARKPISPKQLQILAERVQERKLEGAVAEISKLRFGKKPEELSTWEAGFMIDFFGKYPASLAKKSAPSQ